MSLTRTPVVSSSIKSLGHEGDVLEVEFQNGRVYQHTPFSAEDFAALSGAPSIGQHYNAHVRGQVAHTRIDDSTKEGAGQ